jgi:hypothetical protein
MMRKEKKKEIVPPGNRATAAAKSEISSDVQGFVFSSCFLVGCGVEAAEAASRRRFNYF